MTYVATLNYAQEEFLAYLSSWGPLGTEVAFNLEEAAADLGYCDRRSIYQLFYQLRDKGLAEMVKGDGHRLGKTTFVCFSRPEDCRIVDKSKCRTRGIRKPRVSSNASARIVAPAPRDPIRHAGFDRRGRRWAS